jgi:hypothetical protein
VGGLIASLANARGQALLDGGARRMRALTGYDRVTLLVGDSKATSGRSGLPFPSGANASLSDDFPALVSDSTSSPIPIFPRSEKHSAAAAALLRAPTADEKTQLGERGFASTLRVPVVRGNETFGEFRLAHRSRHQPNFELHAAAELFAQMFALRHELDQVTNL